MPQSRRIWIDRYKYISDCRINNGRVGGGLNPAHLNSLALGQKASARLKRFFKDLTYWNILKSIIANTTGVNLPTLIKAYCQTKRLSYNSLLENKTLYNRIYQKIYRFVNALKEEGYVTLSKLDGLIIARPVLPAIFDLMILRCVPETRIKPYQKGKKTTDKTQNPSRITEKDLINHARQLLTLRWERDHPIHRQVAEKYSFRSRLKKEEQKDVVAHMEQWIDSVLDLVLVFRNLETNEIVALPYTTRYTDYSRASALIRESGKAFQKAKEQFNGGIFLTITLPPIFPFKLALWILSFLHHRVKAYIRKKCGENRPHFRAIEPQESYSPHTHSVIFGIEWLMDKEELTNYLEKHLTNFLEHLGDHYQKTINKRASDLDVQALNYYGRLLKEKYEKYKEKVKKKAKDPSKAYTGPINWITRVYKSGNVLVLENPPPDYSRWLSRQDKATDGGKATVEDYIRKYTIKNVFEAKEIAESGESSKIKNLKLGFYFLTRSRFFTISPALRNKKPKPPPSGWQFVGTFNQKDPFLDEL
jgi:hypothetical protein